MQVIKKLVKKRNIKKLILVNTVAILTVLFFIFGFDLAFLVNDSIISPGSLLSGSNEFLSFGNSFKQFDTVINYINKYNPDISVPLSMNFDEQDTTTVADKNSIGSYVSRGENIGCWDSDVKYWFKGSYQYLSEKFLVVNDNIKERVSKSHTGIINSLKLGNDLPYFGEKYYNGSGIVIVGGGFHSLMTYSVIKVIRSTGTTLPIEVVIPDLAVKKTDLDFCTLIEDLNGSCVFLKDHFSKKTLSSNKFKGFQYKSLALLISSFQNVLLLDADDYPLMNLDDIFDSEVFVENGMVVWPDFWRRTTHPFFYESANMKINFENRVRNFIDSFTRMKSYVPQESDVRKDIPYHDFEGTLPDPSSETGQFLIDKKKHWNSLILSFYYNSFGPNLYYHLMSQYSAGQGDKETFLAAAHVLSLPYYQVLSSPSMDGYHSPDGSGFKSTGYYQKDFRHDSEIKKSLLSSKQAKAIYDNTYSPLAIRENYFSADATVKHSMFAHCNLPKFNPIVMAFNNEFIWEGKHFRGLKKKESLANIDLEKEIIGSYYDVLCLSSKKPFESLIKEYTKIKHVAVCQYLRKRLDLFGEIGV